jgi:hypothetical protein
MPPVDIRTIANEAAEAGWAWVPSTSSTQRMLRYWSGPSGRPLSWIRVLMDFGCMAWPPGLAVVAHCTENGLSVMPAS